MGNAPTVLVVQTLLTTEFSSKPGRAFSIASTNRAPLFLIPYELIFLVYIPGGACGRSWETRSVFQAIVENAAPRLYVLTTFP